LRFYEYELKKETVRQRKLQEHVNLPGRTADGKKLEVAANVGSLEEVALAFRNGAEGIGLFRTEMLFINRNQSPSEEEQFSIYSETARIAGSRPVIVRTLDIGGDKRISYLPLPEEENPYLGCRAVRMYNKYHSVIDAHLRALIRASAFGNLKVMFPMISNIDEVRMMREWMRKIMNEYAKKGVAFNERLQIGVMIEVPSAAFIIDQLSREVDFFSIGSNDLAQYFVAVDRGNINVTYLCNTFQPSFLRLIKHVIDEAHRWGKWIGLCGEMGGNLLATPFFVGCEIDEISLVHSSIPSIKHLISKCNSIDCRDLLQSTLQRENADEVGAELRTFAKQWIDDSLISVENVQLYSDSTTKEEAIKELVDLLELAGRLSDADKVEEALWQREEVYSTGVGFGIAIPHCKSSDVIINSIAMLRLRNPIEWKSLDASPVRLVLMLAVNANDLSNDHLKMIAKLSRKLMDEEYRNKLIRAESAIEVITLLNFVLTV
jgi:fructose-specific PTS system IIA-like component